jgi:hypothetical protein
MQNITIFMPVLALAAWTIAVLLLVPMARISAVRARRLKPSDFRYGESANVPGELSLPNRNYMNLLELPILFYVLCVVLFVTGKVTNNAVTLAWVFVATRIVHSGIHLSYNNVLHRLLAFASSLIVLIALLINTFLAIRHGQ